MPNDAIELWRSRAGELEREANRLFAKYGGHHARVIHLKDLYKKLSGLPVDVQSYFEEAIECLEWDLRRAGTVMAWAGFFNVFMDDFWNKREAEIRVKRTKWTFKDLTELKENYGESQLLETARVVGFIKKATFRKYDGQLSTRNQCAHPTLYRPGQNEAIAYLELMIQQAARYL